MKNIKNVVKNAIARIRTSLVDTIDRLSRTSLKTRFILGGSGLVVLAIIVGLGVCLTNLGSSRNDVVLTSDSGEKTKVTDEQIKTALTTKAEVQKDPVASITATNTVASATIPDGNGGAVANPAIVDNQPKPVPEGNASAEPAEPSKPTEQPSQPTEQPSQPSQPTAPSRDSAESVANHLRSTFFRKSTNNSDVNSQWNSCTPSFLANAMPIIDSFIAGGISEGTARSQIAALDLTGDCIDKYGQTVIVKVESVDVVNVTMPAGNSIADLYSSAGVLNGGCVMNLGVTYDSSSDTYNVRGININVSTRVKK